MTDVIDLSCLEKLEIDEETIAFQPRWENVLVLAAYGKDKTFILTIRGEKIILHQRLKTVLRDFSMQMGIRQIETRTLFKMVNERTFSFVAGHYTLVPTCGHGNQQVVYYMGHHVDHLQKDPQRNAVLISFAAQDKLVHISVDSCYRTVERLLTSANEAGKIQLEMLKNLCHQFGVQSDEFARYTCSTSHENRLYRLQHEQVFLGQIIEAVQQTAEQQYAEDLPPAFYRQLRHVLSAV